MIIQLCCFSHRSRGQYHTNDNSSNCKICQLPIPNECTQKNATKKSVYDGTMLLYIYALWKPVWSIKGCLYSEWIWAARTKLNSPIKTSKLSGKNRWGARHWARGNYIPYQMGSKGYIYIWGFSWMGIPQNGWFTVENHIFYECLWYL